MSIEKTIATLVGKLRFDVDATGLRQFEKMLDRVEARMRSLDKRVNSSRLGKQLASSNRAQLTQAKLTRELFSEKLRTSKLQLLTEKQSLQLQAEQSKLAAVQQKTAQQAFKSQALQHKAELQHTKAQAAARTYSLRNEQQLLRVERDKFNTQAAQSRLQATMARTKVAELRLQERLNKAAAKASTKARGSVWGQRLSHLSSSVGNRATGAVGVSLPLPAMSGATAGLGALAAATIAATAALKAFADSANEAGSQQRMRTAQFTAITEGTGSNAKEAQGVFFTLADRLGLSVKATSDAYAKGLTGMVDGGMKLSEGQSVMQGLLSFAKASNLSNPDQDGVLRAVGQMLSKGQLYAEEWQGQFSERMAGAQKLGSQSWAEITGSGLKGQGASKAFKDAMADGKIAGDKLLAFLTALAARMEKEANRGGKLDVAINSPESQRNRVENIQQRNLVAAAEYDNGRLSQTATQLAKSWADFNTKAQPVYEALAGPAADVNERLASLLDTLAPHLPKLAAFINDVSEFASSVSSAPETQALGTELGRLADNLRPVLSAAEQLVSLQIEVAKTASKIGGGALAGNLMVINETLEKLPAAFDRMSAIIDQIKAKVTGVWESISSILPSFRKEDTPEDKERRKHYSGTPQWTKPDTPSPILPDVLKPEWLKRFDSPAVLDNVYRLTQPTDASKLQPSTTTVQDNRSVHAEITVNGSNLSAAEIGEQLRGSMQEIASSAFDDRLRKQYDVTKGALVESRK